jgi:NAD(P)-dependent dehydrogenase (short-subunit alcohol dehydrogenase family)
MTVNDRIAIVSGSASGIGLAIAERLQTNGYQVVGLDKEYSGEVATSCGHLGIARIRCDVSSYSDVRRVVEQLRTHGFVARALVNNAGVFDGGQFSDFPEHRWERLWRVNVSGMVYLSQAFFELIGGSGPAAVVNIASTDGVVASAAQHCALGVSHDVHYAVTKGAVVTLTRALAMAWARSGIRVNAVAPTIVDTPMTAELLGDAHQRSALELGIPLGRVATPHDVANAVAFLLSHDSAMVTGHVLPVDGGYLCQ